MDGNLLYAFGLTVFAGLATGIGSALAFFAKKTNTRFLSVAPGFSAGVMIHVSMIEIFAKARDPLTAGLGARGGTWVTDLAAICSRPPRAVAFSSTVASTRPGTKRGVRP